MRKRNAALAIAWTIAAIIVVAPYVIGVRLAPDVTGGVLAIDRLDRIRPGSVVFIGSSMTKCAVPYDSQFAAIAASKGLHLDFVRITNSNGTQEDFADVMDRIGRSRASLVLIEAEMLLRQPDRWQRRLGATHWTRAYRAQLRALRIRFGLAKEQSENTGDSDCDLSGNGATTEEMDRVATLPRVLRTDPWLPSFRAMIESAGTSGKRIVVVSLGRSAGLEARIDPGYRRQFRSALQRLQAGKEVEVWIFPSAMLPDAAYSDGAHLIAQGRIAFTNWLIGRMAADRAGN